MRLLARLWGARRASAAVRRLSPADARAVAAIHAEGFTRGWPVAEIEAMIADPQVIGDGVFRGRRLAGFVLSRLAADEAEILSIAVAGAARRGGLGATLLGVHLASVAARGARRLFLEVEAGNAAALALYRRYGFAEVARREAYYRKPDGGAAAALVLRRDLA